MGSTSKPWDKKTKVDTLFDLLQEGVAEDLVAVSESTGIKYLKSDEEEWLKTRLESGAYGGIPTGFEGLDLMMGSFLPGELFTIGGDTGHGKSLLAMNIAQNAYRLTQQPVLMVNLELTESQARERFYELSGADRDYAGILIQEAPAVAYKDIDILMKKAKEEGAGLVIIDHLHFFSRSADNETRELSRIMKHFKECAVQNELSVILLCHITPTRQMNPDGTIKKVFKPSLHNFKGSSSIEQDSDMVGFVFRDEDNPTVMEFYMKKNRSRPLNTQSTYLNQDGWRLEQDTAWLPTNSKQSGESSPANRLV